MKPAGALILVAAFLMSANLGCSFFNSVIGKATPTATTPAPSATSTATQLPPSATTTPTTTAMPAISATTSPAPVEGPASPVAPVQGITFPVTFEITLNAPATVCGEAISSNFTVTLTDASISMYQHEYQLTTSGPYDPSSGNFTSTLSGLPGTQTYSGVVSLTPGPAGVVVAMNGQFTYTGDPEYTCPEADIFSGQATINP